MKALANIGEEQELSGMQLAVITLLSISAILVCGYGLFKENAKRNKKRRKNPSPPIKYDPRVNKGSVIIDPRTFTPIEIRLSPYLSPHEERRVLAHEKLEWREAEKAKRQGMTLSDFVTQRIEEKKGLAHKMVPIGNPPVATFARQLEQQETASEVNEWMRKIFGARDVIEREKVLVKLVKEVQSGKTDIDVVTKVVKKGRLGPELAAIQHKGMINPVLAIRKEKTMEQYSQEEIEAAMKKFADSFAKPLKVRKPTKAQLARWAKMPSIGDGITEKDREEAWKRGCII